MKIKLAAYLILLGLFVSCGASDEQKKTSDEANVESVMIGTESTGEPDTNVLSVSNESETAETYTESDCDINLRAYLSDPDPSGTTNIRATPGGEVIMTLSDDEDYFLQLEGASNGWFKIYDKIGGIDVDYPIPGGVGWIQGSVIGFATRNYGGETIHFYESADENSAVVASINQETLLRPKEICGNWANVQGTDQNGKKFTGWVQTFWLCGNPLTNCS